MSSDQQIPPWLQEQLLKLQQTQQNLQAILAQKQQLGMEQLESDKALEELNKASDEDTVYKHAGSILIKSNKKDLIVEIEEKKELAKTRSIVLEKQEKRNKENLKEQETKIQEMIKQGTSGSSSSFGGSVSSGTSTVAGNVAGSQQRPNTDSSK